MGGGGGQSGEVVFPDYIMDSHAYIMTGLAVDAGGSFAEEPDNLPTRSIFQMLNTAFNTNPWSNFSLTNPSGAFNNVDSRLTSFANSVTSYDMDNMNRYVENALKAVTQVSSSDVPNVPSISVNAATYDDVVTLFNKHADALISKLPAVVSAAASSTSLNQTKLNELITSASSLAQNQANFAVSTTSWIAMIGAITSTIKDCQLPKEVNIQSVLTKAAQDADNNLKAALEVVRDYATGTLVQELVSSFQKRRETTYQQQASQYAGTMADLNAVNSSSFMFGMAIIRSEQMREVAEFDSQISISMLREGLQAYVQMHSSSLQAGMAGEEANARHHTAIVNASLNLMTTLQDRGELKPSDLLGAFTDLFRTEVGNNAQAVDALMRHMGFIRQNNQRDNTQRELRDTELEIAVEQINKEAKETRYLRGLQAVSDIVANEVEFQRVLTQFELDYRDRRSNAINIHEEKEARYTEQSELWDFKAVRLAADYMAAPQGMAAAIPDRPTLGREIFSTVLQTGGNILSKRLGG